MEQHGVALGQAGQDLDRQDAVLDPMLADAFPLELGPASRLLPLLVLTGEGCDVLEVLAVAEAAEEDLLGGAGEDGLSLLLPVALAELGEGQSGPVGDHPLATSHGEDVGQRSDGR